MKPKNALLKLATIVSSVVLLSGFVCYRAGAFHWLMGSAQPADSTNNATVQPATPQGRADVIMSGSKSMVVDFGSLTVPGSPTPPAPGEPTPPVVDRADSVPQTIPPPPSFLIDGPKSGRIFIPTTPPAKTTTPPPAPAQQSAPGQTQAAPVQQAAPVILLPGSKSEEIFRPSPPAPAGKPVPNRP